MSYLTDNPWPLIILLAAVAVVAFLTGSSKGRGVAALTVLAAVGVFFLERYLISPSEEVEIQVEQLLTHFKSSDIDGISSQISKQNQQLVEAARQGLELVTVEDSFHIKSVELTMEDDGSNAIALVRANGNLTPLKHGGGGSRYWPTFWRMTWQPEGDAWKLREVIRLNPANGVEIGILSAE